MKGVRVVVALAAVAVIASCGGVKKPDWVTKGGAAFPGDRGKALYGVGVIAKTPNPHLKRTAACNRARQDIAAQINTYIARFMKDFTEQHRDFFNPDAAGSDELIQIISKSVSEASVIGAQIHDTWEDPKTGDFYCLVRLDIDTMFDQLREKTKQIIRERHRGVVVERANELLNELDKAIDQKRQYENQFIQ